LFKDSADEETKALLKKEYQKKSRDNARTPMQWDDSPQAGFTTGSTPWMRVNDNYKEINAASQVNDPESVFSTYKSALDKRKEHKDIFVYGDFELVDEENDKVFAYKRVARNGNAALIVCNFSTDEVVWSSGVKAREVLVSSTGRKTVGDGEIRLVPCEAIALLL
jgi:glycosidase